MVSDMPAIVAMEKYCEEVENFNENWWQLMTENCTYEEKAKMLSMAEILGGVLFTGWDAVARTSDGDGDDDVVVVFGEGGNTDVRIGDI